MAEWEAPGETGAIKRKVIAVLLQEILQLNPGLAVDHLAVGQEIAIPVRERREAIITAALAAMK